MQVEDNEYWRRERNWSKEEIIQDLEVILRCLWNVEMEIMEGFVGLGLLMVWMGANDMMMRWIEKEKVIDGDKYRMLIKSWKPTLLNWVTPDEFHDFVVVTDVLCNSVRKYHESHQLPKGQ